MENEKVIKFVSRIESIIDTSRIENELSYVEIVGALVMIAFDVYIEANEECEDDEEIY